MIMEASRRSALIAATAGLFVLLAGPVMATDGADSRAGAASDNQAAAPAKLHRTYKQAWHHRRHYAHHKSHAVAKADEDRTADDVKKPVVPVAATVASDNKPSAEIPPSVANANAQMMLAGVQINAAVAMPPGTDVPQAATTNTASADNKSVVVASDQLNDIDRTLQEASPSAATNTSPPQASAPTMTGESSVWDQTSLIGKIFIGFGALLTMASAARMFMT